MLENITSQGLRTVNNAQRFGVEIEKPKNREMKQRLNIFNEYLDKMLELYETKNHDYGDSVSKTFDEYGLTSFLVRMDDKMNRLKTLNKVEDAAVRGEKIEDTLLDLANYAVLALTEIEFRKKLLLTDENDILESEMNEALDSYHKSKDKK